MLRYLLIFLTCIWLCISESRNETEISKTCADNPGTSASDLSLLFLLNRINEKLTSATNSNENVIRKLENIDNRLTNMEIRTLEKTEDLRTENKLTTIKIENIERSMNSLKQNLDSSKYLVSDNSRISTSNNSEEYFYRTRDIASLERTKKPRFEYTSDISKMPYDCVHALRLFGNVSGVYKIQPQHSPAPITVYCDHSVRGGGWTVIQSRINGSLDFYRTWSEYKQGFGDPHGEYWLGLENIHLLTSQKINEVYFMMEDFNNDKAYAHYNGFVLGPESSNYQVSFLGTYEGTAGDSFSGTKGLAFSAYDRDNDSWPENCAKHFSGAWWHSACFACNLNGNYTKGALSKDQYAVGVVWNSYKGLYYSLKSTRMMVRPRIQQVTAI